MSVFHKKSLQCEDQPSGFSIPLLRVPLLPAQEAFCPQEWPVLGVDCFQEMNFKESMTWVLQAFSAQLSFFLWWWAVIVGLFLLKYFFLCSLPGSSNCYICSRRAPSQASGSAYLILLLDHKNMCCHLTGAPGFLLIVWDMSADYYRAVVLCVCISAVGDGN